MLKELLGDLYTPEIEEKLKDKKLILDDGSYIKKTDYDSLSKEISKLKENDYGKENEKLKADIQNLIINHGIETALYKAGAVNTKAVSALLDKTKINLKDDNSIEGLDEQLKLLQESDKWAFNSPSQKIDVPGVGGNPVGKENQTEIADKIVI